MNFNDLYKESSIDHTRDIFSPSVFINPEDDKPELKPTIVNQIQHHVNRFGNLFKVRKFFIKGSILTKQYNNSADIDIYIQGDIPDNESIKQKIEELNLLLLLFDLNHIFFSIILHLSCQCLIAINRILNCS